MAGRPTLYKGEETIKQAEDYLLSCVDNEGKVNLPKYEGLALWLDCSIDTLYEWAKVYPVFSDILDKVKKEQANRVIDRALGGQYNANIAKLLLGKHGYSEKSEVEQKTTLEISGNPEVAAKFDEFLKQQSKGN